MQETRSVDDDFSLRDENNKVKIEDILDDLILKLEENEYAFISMFKNLPLDIYLKIDSLAYTYSDRKGEDIRRISRKAKLVNKTFHNKFK